MHTTMTRNRAIFVYGTILILLLQIPTYFLLRLDADLIHLSSLSHKGFYLRQLANMCL